MPSEPVAIPAPELVREQVMVAGLPHPLSFVRPRSAEALIDEAAFGRDERLPYWAELWPSARVLADALAARDLRGRRMLELGCGLGLPAIVALLRGADVLATDWYSAALALAARNARAVAGRPLLTLLVDWRHPPPALLTATPFDLIVGADLLYEPRNGGALATLIPRLVAPAGEVLIADPRRPDAVHLLRPLAAAGWRHSAYELPYRGRPDESGSVIRLHTFRPPVEGGGNGAAIGDSRASARVGRSDPR